MAAAAAAIRTDGIERISVREAAYHTKINRLYALEAIDMHGSSSLSLEHLL